IAWLAVGTAILVALVVIFVLFTGIAPANEDGTPMSTPALLWDSFMQAVGAEAIGSDTGSWPFLFAMLVLMIGGLFIASTLIGVLTSGIEQKLGNLQRGRSFVAETGHTVVLGWSSKTAAVVKELVMANESKSNQCIAVLAEKDRTEMEEIIREELEGRTNTRVVCRTGDPIVLGDLDIVNPLHARAVVIPSPEVDEPDAQVIKMILALSHHPNREAEKQPYIVAELNESAWKDVALMVGDSNVEPVLIHEVISRIISQVSRQTGLSVVASELLTFEGNEFYYAPAASLAGRTYGEALFAYPDASLVGIHSATGADINPPNSQIIGVDDRLIVLAEDDSTTSRIEGDGRLTAESWGVQEPMIVTPKETVAIPEHHLILGWSPRAPRIIRTTDGYLASGSNIEVVTTLLDSEEQLRSICGELDNASLSFSYGDPTNRTLLEKINVGRFDHVIVMSRSQTNPQAADTHALVTLLHLRDLADQNDYGYNIVSEMNDVRNQELAEVTRADDFVVSDRLISLMVAQIAENRHLSAVFSELFSPSGAELYLRSAVDYVAIGMPMPFYAVVEAARRREETALGYRRASESYDKSRQYGIRLNPRGTQTITFEDNDRLIVLANE
ncbi:MAG: NAD-binding protein, partial [Rubricoccaceae bacterium]|nr:NAD-binding protein [Rubricoccaceae bacterium]